MDGQHFGQTSHQRWTSLLRVKTGWLQFWTYQPSQLVRQTFVKTIAKSEDFNIQNCSCPIFTQRQAVLLR